MTEEEIKQQTKLLGAMIESLNQVSGGCSQMMMHRGDPRWLMPRTAVDLVRDAVIQKASMLTAMFAIRPSA